MARAMRDGWMYSTEELCRGGEGGGGNEGDYNGGNKGDGNEGSAGKG